MVAFPFDMAVFQGQFPSEISIGSEVLGMECTIPWQCPGSLDTNNSPNRLAGGTLDIHYPFRISSGLKTLLLHPGRFTWNLQITHLERKMIFQTSMIMVHVNLPGCKPTWPWENQSTHFPWVFTWKRWIFSMAPSSVWFFEVGGVVSLSPTHWRGINGFSNEYDGWGGEAWTVATFFWETQFFHWSRWYYNMSHQFLCVVKEK